MATILNIYIISSIICCVIATSGGVEIYKSLTEDDKNMEIGEKVGWGIISIITWALLVVGCFLPIISDICCMLYLCFFYDKYKTLNIFKVMFNLKDKSTKIQGTIEDLYDVISFKIYGMGIDRVYNKYKRIIKQPLYKSMVENRIEYVFTIAKNMIDNNIHNNESVQSDLRNMFSELDSFLDEILSQIQDIKNEQDKKTEQYLKDKMKEFSEVTNLMKTELKNIK